MSFLQKVFYVTIWFALFSRVLFSLFQLRSSKAAPSCDVEEELSNKEAPDIHGRWHNYGISYAIWLILLFYVYRRGFSFQNVVGGDWGTWPVSSLSRNLFPHPSLWNFNNLGSSNLAGAALYPIESAAGLLVRFGSSYGLAEHILFFWPPLLALFASGVIVSRKLRFGATLSGAVGFLIAASTPVGAFMAGGWFPILMGAALLIPIIRLFYAAQSAQRTIGIGLLVGVDIWYDPRNAIVLALGILSVFLIDLIILKNAGRSILHHLRLWPAALIAVALQAGWILPLMAGSRVNLPAGYQTSAAAVTFSFNNLGNGMSWFNYAWPVLHLGQIQNIPLLLMALPVLMLIGTLGRVLSRFEIWLLAIFLATSLLAGGGNPPFGSIYVSMFTNIPGFDLFRDDSVYLPYCVVTSAAFVSIGLLRISQFVIRLFVKLSNSLARYSRGLILGSVSVFVIAISSVAALPISNGTVSGDISSVGLSTSENQLNDFLLRQTGNIVWVPEISALAPRGNQLSPNLSSTTVDDMLTKSLGLSNDASSLFWLNSTNDVRATSLQFGISHVIIDENSSDYSSISRGNWIKKDVIPSLKRQFCQTSSCPVFGHWIVIPTNTTGIVSSMVRLIPKVDSSATSSKSKRIWWKSPVVAHYGFRLPTSSCFIANRMNSAQWSQVGNVDNFQGLTYQASGLYEDARNPNAITIGIRSGAAAISTAINGCREITDYSPNDLVTVRLLFHSSRNATVSAILIRGNQTAKCQFSGSSRFMLHSCLLSFPSSPSRNDQSSTRPTLMLSVAPIDNPSPSQSAKVTFLSAQVLVSPSTFQESPIQPSFAESISSLRTISNTGYQFEQPLSDNKRIVFYQSYDPNWIATIQQGHQKPQVLRHFKALGWANGYRIPNNVTGDSVVTIHYRLQEPLNLGMNLAAVTFLSPVVALICIQIRRKRFSCKSKS